MGPATSAQFLMLASGTNPSPSQTILGCFIFVLSSLPPRKMSRSVILAAPVLFPLGSIFCHLHWDTLAPPFNLQLDAIVLVSVAHETSDPIDGLEWKNFNHSLLPASWK